MHKNILIAKHHIKKYFTLIISLLLVGCNTTQQFGERDDVQQFITHVAQKDNFDKQQLTSLFNTVQSNKKVLKSISKPAESKPWLAYRSILVTPKRAQHGAKFWENNATTLTRAEQQYGVPTPLIVAILGVETNYGENQGRFRVLDSLSTLAFDYPARSNFFRSELEQYLLLTREHHFEPTEIVGSYAGAIGQPQFMPSSYRRYAVDYTGKGHADLIHNTPDAIGSIANYLKAKGWQPQQPVAIRANVSGQRFQQLANASGKKTYTVAELARYGIKPIKSLPPHEKVTFMVFDAGEEQPEYWLGLHNFSVIMLYNTSRFYAMAVHQLSQNIQTKKGKHTKTNHIS